jgi:hypothetical protein
VEHRGGDHRPLARPERDHREQGGGRVERARLGARRALRRPRRARGEDDRLAALGRRLHIACVALRDQILHPRVVRLAAVRVVPGDVALAAPRRVVDQLLELVVVDQRLGLLALGDVGELRAGERRVEEQHVGAELRARDHRVGEAAMVAAHDADAVARLDAVGGQRVGQRVRARVDLAERERPELVDDRGL